MTSNDNTRIIDRLVDAYNSSNARGFADLFAPDVVVYEHPNKPTQQSREEIFERYTEVFKKFPLNKTEVVHRIVIGDWVIDHEKVRRSPEHEPFDVVAVYELQDGEIKRLDFIRKS
ncbi:MAG: nuclear transport factor 2 family protein [Trueperaceae bacterium]